LPHLREIADGKRRKQSTNEDGRTLTQYMDVSTLKIVACGLLATTNFAAATGGAKSLNLQAGLAV
jgi:hypothetical protein